MTTTLQHPSLPYQIISRGEASGSYQAFPDACRLHNGDIAVVFYSGYAHVSYPNEEYPNGGRICMVRSADEGRTWSEPQVIYDDEHDNRDPHLAQLGNGTLICSFFSLYRDEDAADGYATYGAEIVRSFDGGLTWEAKGESIQTDSGIWNCSAPVREIAGDVCLLPIYCQRGEIAWGGVVRSDDSGATWGREIPIGQEAGLFLPAETDIVQLKDGTLYAALRGQLSPWVAGVPMHFATSRDDGLTWSEVQDIGFYGHAPHLTRLSSGEILLSYRGFAGNEWSTGYTALRISHDEGQSWQGPYVIDSCLGAYPATVELKGGNVLIVYFEEGEASAIRAVRVHKPSGEALVPLSND